MAETIDAGAREDARAKLLGLAAGVAVDLERFTRRDKPSERAERNCDRRPAPDLAVLGAVPHARFVERAVASGEEAAVQLEELGVLFGVAFALLGTDDARVPTAPDYVMAVCANGEQVIFDGDLVLDADYDVWSLYGPDYETCDAIHAFIHDVCRLAEAAVDLDVLEEVVGVLTQAKLRPVPNPPAWRRTTEVPRML